MTADTIGPGGVLVVDKPSGKTSHDVVGLVRRALGTKRVGHAGTLDPMATGVLVILVGEGTKLGPYLTLQTKTYRARVAFGVGTDTLDAEGTVVARGPIPEALARDPGLALEAALANERARREQVPPIFSAIHVDGQRSYDRARAGESFDLPPRPVSVDRLEIVEASGGAEAPFVDVELTVSKGYYVRSLARDLGDAIGTPAHLTALRRLASGPFTLKEAASLDDRAELRGRIVPLADAAKQNLPHATLTDIGVARARQGKALAAEHFVAAPPADVAAAWIGEHGELVAIGERATDASTRILRGFVPY